MQKVGLFSRFSGKSKGNVTPDKISRPDSDLVSPLVGETGPETERLRDREGGVVLEADLVGADLGVRPAEEKTGWFSKLKQGLSKTRKIFGSSISTLILGRKEIDQDLFEELETILLSADVGMDATAEIIKNLTEQAERKILKDPESLILALKTQLKNMLQPIEQNLIINKTKTPYVILMVGINGAGKTTTIGKLAKKFQAEGHSVLLAAGDTFRAAAVEQLEVWGERNQVEVIAQKNNADSASVIFDAMSRAKARNIDIVIADTAGRLHNKQNLMGELSKIGRVMQKFDLEAPHEVLLVLDSTTGQNALIQAIEFKKSVNVSGLVLTKLDGTAKGGILFAIAKILKIPVRYIGVGESIEDLRVFNSDDFVEAMFD